MIVTGIFLNQWITREERIVKMHILPEAEAKAKDYSRDRVYGHIMMVCGVCVAAFLLFGWALPYNGIL